VRCSQTRLVGIATRTMSSVTTVGFGAGRHLSWVVPHTYRKTVATMLDRQGLSARIIADQLGHARISMTQDVYMGRRAVDQAAAAVLEGISPPGHDGDDEPPAVPSVVV
jgi:integrase